MTDKIGNSIHVMRKESYLLLYFDESKWGEGIPLSDVRDFVLAICMESTQEERREIFTALHLSFCRDCARTLKPDDICHCENDE